MNIVEGVRMKNMLEMIEFQITTIEEKENSTLYRIQIKVPMEMGWIERMKWICEDNERRFAYPLSHTENDDVFACFEGEVELSTKALYHHYFSFEANGEFIYFKKRNQEKTHEITKEEMWKMSSGFSVPSWAKGKIMYHIFVDRFCKGENYALKPMPNREIYSSWDDEMRVGPDTDGNWNVDFYGGNLKGIYQKLDYIQSLGVSILYLSPVVWSQSNHRYDTSDYETVDPYAGTNQDLKNLCDAAHQKGMRVILDAVFNHTGNDSKYFNEYEHFDELGAFQSQESKYYSFFRKYISNNQTFFDYWWGMPNLPVCDGSSKDWQDYIYGEGGIIDLWFSLGIDGLRLDVADELSDEFIEGIHRAVKRNKEDGFILGEVWKNPMRMNRSYLESGKGMHSVMNYPLMDALFRYFKYKDVPKLSEVIRNFQREYPVQTIHSLMNFTSTHDMTRVINLLGTKHFSFTTEWAWDLHQDLEWQKNTTLSEEEYQRGKEVYKTLVAALTFFPGNLSIFYGDEVGVQGFGNLCNRKPYPWGKEDLELLLFFQKMGYLRKMEPFLETADFQLLDINTEYMMFLRKNRKEEALMVFNRSSHDVSITLPSTYQNAKPLLILKDSTKEYLPSHGALVLKK